MLGVGITLVPVLGVLLEPAQLEPADEPPGEVPAESPAPTEIDQPNQPDADPAVPEERQTETAVDSSTPASEPSTPPQPAPVEPSVAAEAQPPVVVHRPATEYEPPEPEAAKPITWHRYGLLFGFGVGYLGCARAWCDIYGGGGLGRLEVGYRYGRIAPLVELSGGGGHAKLLPELREIGFTSANNVTFVDVGAGVMVYPVRRGRFDLFFGAKLGWTHTKLRLGFDGGRGREWLNRGAARLALGFTVFASEYVSVGPRFDVSIPFAGRICASVSAGAESEKECWAVKDIDEELLIDPRDLPVPWAITVDLRVVIPVLVR